MTLPPRSTLFFRSRSSKKGQISIQFNWIFVLIVGVIIFGFFLTTINTTSQTSQTKVSVTIAKSFQTIFTSSAQKDATVKTFATPQGTLAFTCSDSAGFYDYRFNDYVVDQIKYDLIVGPKELVGNQLFTYTEKWSLGFDVGTFLYATNEDTAYVFSQEQQSKSTISSNAETSSDHLMTSYRDFLNVFPTNFTKIIVEDETDIEALSSQRYAHYVVFAFEEQDVFSILDKLPSDDVTVVHIKPLIPSDVFGAGMVSVYGGSQVPTNWPTIAFDDKKTDDASFEDQVDTYESSHTAPYLGKASLFAAVFSQDINMYRCTMNKALKKSYLLSSLLYNKTLNQSHHVSHVCQDLLGVGDLSGPVDHVQTIRDSSSSSNRWTLSVAQTLKDASTKLSKTNAELYISGTCPVIY
ncbi:MAG: hypothetical protein ACLFNM_00240 [Candidatus Woesearchaeota archaeon]